MNYEAIRDFYNDPDVKKGITEKAYLNAVKLFNQRVQNDLQDAVNWVIENPDTAKALLSVEDYVNVLAKTAVDADISNEEVDDYPAEFNSWAFGGRA